MSFKDIVVVAGIHYFEGKLVLQEGVLSVGNRGFQERCDFKRDIYCLRQLSFFKDIFVVAAALEFLAQGAPPHSGSGNVDGKRIKTYEKSLKFHITGISFIKFTGLL